jgi:ABC-2 type transport system permease protein/oleandomycin transport system permease protein
MARSAVLAGRTFADIATNLLSPIGNILLGLLLMIMLGYAFSWVFAYIGMISSTPEAANAIGFMTIFPLTFISSAFVPVESMPAALQAFAEVNPFTTAVDAMRHLWQARLPTRTCGSPSSRRSSSR